MHYAAFTPYRNYRNSEMTTSDVQLGAVHVLRLGIIRFYSDSQQNEPVWKNVEDNNKIIITV